MLNRSLACLASLLAPVAFAAPGPGDTPPPLSLESVTQAPDDAPVSWEAFEGRTVVLDFWGTWCGPCIASIPHMNALRAAFPEDEVVFLAVTFEDENTTNRFAERIRFDTWIGHDTDRSMVRDFGVEAWPTTFVINPDGVIAARTHSKNLTAEKLRAYIDDRVIDERDPNTGASKRPTVRDIIQPDTVAPGFDPYLPFVWRSSAQVIVRKTPYGASGRGGNSGQNHTYLGIDARTLLARVADLPPGYVLGDIERVEGNYDLVLAFPDARATPETRAAAITLAAAALGLTATVREEIIEGYALRVVNPDLAPKETETSEGCRWSEDSYSSEGFPVSSFANWLTQRLGVPVVDETRLEGPREFSVSAVPTDPDEANTLLRDRLGLELTPAPQRVTVCRTTKAAAD